MPDPSSLLSNGADAHERFVREAGEISRAHADGGLDAWLQEKLRRERLAAGFPDGDGGADATE